jgi:2-dehydropantoate 2-reductase
MKKTQIAVIGLGGVGGYIGFKLAQTYANDPLVSVAFVARGETYQVVSKNGLTLLSPEHAEPVVRPAHLAENIHSLPQTDVFLICVKEYDLENVCKQLVEYIQPDTLILPLMNGADIYERIRKIINQGIVLPACMYVASHIKQKGLVEHKGKPGKVIMGKDPQYPSFAPEELFQLLRKASIHVDYQQDAFPAIWTKFIFIASFGLVSACYNSPIGQILDKPPLRKRATSIMEEIQAIALQKNIPLPADIIEQTLRKAATFPPHTPTSLQLDVQAKKTANELELFAGTIMRYGKLYGIPVPATEAIYHQIREEILG